MKAKTLTIALAFVLIFLMGIGAGSVNAQPAPAPAPDAAATAPAPEAGAPGPAGVEPPSATVENPYGLAALWKTGDFVSHMVLFILAAMSLATWYIFVTKYWEQARLLGQAKQTEKQFWSA